MRPAEAPESELTRLLRSAPALEAQGQYPQAHALWQQAGKFAEAAANPGIQALVSQALWRTLPLWWSDLRHGSLGLRRCRVDDAGFFRACFGDAAFSRQFNRLPPWQGQLERALAKAGQLPPLQTGMLMWVVQSLPDGKPLGLASLSGLDVANRRAELAIGFPGEFPATVGSKATLMMLHYALVLMPFNKVYAYVYSDNPQALHNALRLGFVHEGRLADHFRIPGQGYQTVDAIAVTRARLHGSARLKKLARRWISADW
jgi:RimJ/RimL family protein N-acetyltransferase